MAEMTAVGCLDVTPGTEYVRIVSANGGTRHVGPYRVLLVARHAETGQEEVVFQVSGGGVNLVASLNWFATHFEPVVPYPPPVVEKQAGHVQEEWRGGA